MNVSVIGGGASGMMAAIFAARAGASVTLFERNEKLGKKLYITGKGRCNLTNTIDREGFMRAIVRNPRFLYSALDFFPQEALMALIEAEGVPLKVERGNRVYPVSEHASDITKALERAMRRLNVTIRLNARVRELVLDGGAVRGVRLESGEAHMSDAVVIATGGLSYPSTGSTGDGYAFARAAGLPLTPTRPALTAVETVEAWPTRLSGLTLKNVALHARRGKKTLFSEQGEMLLTHFGISGPLVLSLSSVLPGDCAGQALAIDFKPALDREALDARLVRDLRELSRKQMGTVVDGLAPHSLGLELLALAGISPMKMAHSLTQAERARLIDVLKAAPLTVKALRGYAEAVITRGGIDVKAVNPSTMAARGVPGLYIAGEALDIDALTGGYNLQLAFSTGALAGANAAKENVHG